MQYVKQFVRASAATGSTTLYTVGTGKTAVVTSVVVTNTAATSSTYTLVMGGIDFATGVTLPANSTHVYDIRAVLTATQTITGLASGGVNVKWHISGAEA